MKFQNRLRAIIQCALLFCLLTCSLNSLFADCYPANPTRVAASGTDWTALFGTWGTTAADPIDQHIDILPGTTLDLDGETLFLAQHIEIRVHPNARLTFQNCTLKSCDPDNVWRGIYVEGTNSVPVTDPGQGKFGAENSRFENMAVGIYSGENTRGGWIYAKDCEFIDPSGSAVVAKTNDEPVPIVIKDNFFQNNKSYQFGTPWQYQSYFIELNNFCGRTISGNYFENVYTPFAVSGNLGRMGGIRASHSALTLDDNRFNHLNDAIRLVTSNPVQCNGNRMTITNNQFFNNKIGIDAIQGSSEEDDAIYIADNYFSNYEQMGTPSGYSYHLTPERVCINLRNSNRAHIEGNTFDKTEVEVPGEIPFSFTGISLLESHHSAVRKNNFNFTLTPNGTVLPNSFPYDTYIGNNHCLRVLEVDDVLIECNDFNMDISSNQEQSGIIIRNSPLITSIEGINGVCSKNSFSQNPTACGSTFLQYEAWASQTPVSYPTINSFPNPISGCVEPGMLILQPGAADNDCYDLNKHFDDYSNSPWKTAPAIADEVEEAQELSVFPNPASESATLVLPVADGEAHVEIFGVNGVRYMEVRLAEGETRIELDLQDLTRGMYLVKYSRAGQQLVTKKLIVR